MADTWQTIEQAAVTLGLSVRTVNRHIAANKLQSRLADGRREVLVSLAAPQSPPLPTTEDLRDEPLHEFAAPASSVSASAPNGMAGAPYETEALLSLADSAADKADMAISAYQALAQSINVQAESVRRGARFAWVALGTMAVAVTIAVGWTSDRLAKARADVDHLSQQVKSVSDSADAHLREAEQLRTDLMSAREKAARAEGELAARSVVADKPAKADRPVSAEPVNPLSSVFSPPGSATGE